PRARVRRLLPLAGAAAQVLRRLRGAGPPGVRVLSALWRSLLPGVPGVPPVAGAGLEPLHPLRGEDHGLGPQERPDLLVEELPVRRRAAGPGGMAPQRRNGGEGDLRDEAALVFGVPEREIEIGGGRHVEQRNADRAQGLLDVSVEALGPADVVLLPGASLEDEIVGIGVAADAAGPPRPPRP